MTIQYQLTSPTPCPETRDSRHTLLLMGRNFGCREYEHSKVIYSLGFGVNVHRCHAPGMAKPDLHLFQFNITTSGSLDSDVLISQSPWLPSEWLQVAQDPHEDMAGPRNCHIDDIINVSRVRLFSLSC